MRLAAANELVKLLPTVISREEIVRGEWPLFFTEDVMNETAEPDLRSLRDQFSGRWIASRHN